MDDSSDQLEEASIEDALNHVSCQLLRDVRPRGEAQRWIRTVHWSSEPNRAFERCIGPKRVNCIHFKKIPNQKAWTLVTSHFIKKG